MPPGGLAARTPAPRGHPGPRILPPRPCPVRHPHRDPLRRAHRPAGATSSV